MCQTVYATMTLKADPSLFTKMSANDPLMVIFILFLLDYNWQELSFSTWIADCIYCCHLWNVWVTSQVEDLSKQSGTRQHQLHIIPIPHLVALSVATLTNCFSPNFLKMLCHFKIIFYIVDVFITFAVPYSYSSDINNTMPPYWRQ